MNDAVQQRGKGDKTFLISLHQPRHLKPPCEGTKATVFLGRTAEVDPLSWFNERRKKLCMC